MSVAEDSLAEPTETADDQALRLVTPELRQRSVRDLVAELAQLEDSARSTTSSSRVAAGNTARAHRIVAELRRR